MEGWITEDDLRSWIRHGRGDSWRGIRDNFRRMPRRPGEWRYWLAGQWGFLKVILLGPRLWARWIYWRMHRSRCK